MLVKDPMTEDIGSDDYTLTSENPGNVCKKKASARVSAKGAPPAHREPQRARARLAPVPYPYPYPSPLRSPAPIHRDPTCSAHAPHAAPVSLPQVAPCAATGCGSPAGGSYWPASVADSTSVVLLMLRLPSRPRLCPRPHPSRRSARTRSRARALRTRPPVQLRAAPCPAPGIAGCRATRPATNPRFLTN
jgi:hypothetical protein